MEEEWANGLEWLGYSRGEKGRPKLEPLGYSYDKEWEEKTKKCPWRSGLTCLGQTIHTGTQWQHRGCLAKNCAPAYWRPFRHDKEE